MALEPGLPRAEDTADPELARLRRRFWIAFGLTLPLWAVAMLPMLGLWPAAAHAPAARWLQVLLATPVVFGCGGMFFTRGCAALGRGTPNMFTLIGLGTGIAYGISWVGLVLPQWFPAQYLEHGMAPLHFESAATIVLLVLAGQVLELRARGRTSDALRELLRLEPCHARRVDGERETDVPLAEVQPGDLLRVLPHAAVPVDGLVTVGNGSVDESMLTGEPMPVAKAPGSRLHAGTVNGPAALLVRAEQVGTQTLLASIVRLVAQAQRSRARVQSLADRVAAWFVPAVAAVAVVTLCAWLAVGGRAQLSQGLLAAISVLLVACPCALGLATPMALVVGMGRAARQGVLFRHADAIENLARARTLALDKTGTLTCGEPTITQVVTLPGWSEATLLPRVAAVERQSEHPLARAVLARAAHGAGPELAAEAVLAAPGRGVSGIVAGQAVAVGSLAFLREVGVDTGPLLPLMPAAGTLLAAAVGGVAAGWMLVEDPLRPQAAATLQALRQLGFRCVLVTGDRAEPAGRVAAALGIVEVHAGLSPTAKLDTVQALGERVAMVGDGVNDAPALAAASVGIALGTGTGAAIATAPVTLLRGELAALLPAVQIARATLRTIRRNLLLAFGYNVLALPVAAAGWLSPMLAALLMSLSSVSVIASSLLLARRPASAPVLAVASAAPAS